MIVFLDSNVVIYTVENPPGFGPRATARLTALRASNATFMISDLTRMECLVLPLRTGDGSLEARFNAFFSSTGIQVVGITAAVCDQAARIRATTRFKPMDSLQLAAAVQHGANVFLTADARLSSFTGLTVEVLP